MIVHLIAKEPLAPDLAATSPTGVTVDVTDPRERFARLRYQYATSTLTTPEALEMNNLMAQLGIAQGVFDEDVQRIYDHFSSQQSR